MSWVIRDYKVKPTLWKVDSLLSWFKVHREPGTDGNLASWLLFSSSCIGPFQALTPPLSHVHRHPRAFWGSAEVVGRFWFWLGLMWLLQHRPLFLSLLESCKWDQLGGAEAPWGILTGVTRFLFPPGLRCSAPPSAATVLRVALVDPCERRGWVSSPVNRLFKAV